MDTIENLKDLFLAVGATWVVYLLAGLSLVCVAIIVERWLFFRDKGEDLRGVAERLDAHLAGGDHAGAVALLGRHRSIAAAVARAGLRLGHLGPEAAQKAMASAQALERTRLDKRLGFLGTLGNNAPFIGLLGTVIGIIAAFAGLGTGPGSGGGAAGQAASDQVMTAIAEALVTTAVGIAVALPAVAANNYFQRRASALLQSADVLANLVLAYLSAAPGGAASASASASAGAAAGRGGA